MFGIKDEIEETISGLDKAIEECLKEMEDVTADSPEYRSMAENLELLYKSRKLESESKTEDRKAEGRGWLTRKTGIDPNTLITAGASVLGIAMILVYEGNDVIHSKGLGFVMKPRG